MHYQQSELYIEGVNLKNVAEEFGTPCYVYSRAQLESNWRAFDVAFKDIPHLICYAVKANSNIAILQLLARLNSGFDIVSGGELERVIAAGADVKKIVFSGVGKTKTEIERAIEKEIYCFDVESEPELERLEDIAKSMQKKVNIALRVNPNVDPRTHAHITTGLKDNKFGIDLSQVIPICQQLSTKPHLKLIGIACHIGSQITDLKPFMLAADALLDVYLQLKKMDIDIDYLNLGGGLGVRYDKETPPTIHEYANALQEKLSPFPVKLIIEPGRSIVADAGVLLTRIEYIKHSKHKNFAIVDAGMNDLLRPALYDAWQQIIPVNVRSTEEKIYEIVGPVCESADFLGKNRSLAIHAGDFLAVDSAGAYGFSMSSNYNSRPRPAEILIDHDKVHIIRRRETLAELFSLESCLF